MTLHTGSTCDEFHVGDRIEVIEDLKTHGVVYIQAGSLGTILIPTKRERERLMLVRILYWEKDRWRSLRFAVPQTLLWKLGVDLHVGLRIDSNPHRCDIDAYMAPKCLPSNSRGRWDEVCQL